MKFKRSLAALLSMLMLTSVMSFTATVSAEQSGVISEFILAKNQNLSYNCENSSSQTIMYDSDDDLVFERFVPNNSDTSLYVNHGTDVAFTNDQATADDNYLIFYARTNLDNDAEIEGVQMPSPAAMQYTSVWSDTSISHNPNLVQVTEGFASTVTDEWQKFCFKLVSLYTKDETTYYLTKWKQIAFSPVGLRDVMGGDDMYALSDNPYYDVAGFAVVSSLDAAASYDFATEAKAPKVNLTFDLQTAEDDSDVTTVEYVSGKYKTAYVEFPEVTDADFAGWYIGDTKQDVTATAVPSADTTYTAKWYTENPQLESLTINGTTHETYGVSDINADSIAVSLPYGWEKLKNLGVMPEIVPTVAVPSTVAYTAPESLSAEGKITITSGTYTREVPVTFTVAEAAESKSNVPTSGVYSTSGAITLPDGSTTNSRAVGMKSEKTTFKDVTGYKHTPIYTGSELDGTMVSSTEYYTSNRTVNLEGYDAYGLYDYETYEVYRALAYIDTGANGEFDVTPAPYIYFQSSSTTGTVKTNGTGNSNGFGAINNYAGNRWEYIYFVKSDSAKQLYGKARQPVFCIYGNGHNTLASAYTDDVFYCAEITVLPDGGNYVQYKPTGLTVTEIDGDTPGSISGLNGDMEMLVGEEWTKITEVANYADGVLSNLEAGEYSFRYAATETLLASEETTVEVRSDGAYITFDSQNGTEPQTTRYDLNAEIVIPEDPTRTSADFLGWSETPGGAIAELTGLTATEDKTYYAVWKLITKYYVDGTAEASGNGRTSDTPFCSLKEAWDLLRADGGTIVIMGDTVLDSRNTKEVGDLRLVNGNGDIVITNKDGDTAYEGKLIFGYHSHFKNAEDTTGKLTFENINIVQEHSYGGQDKSIYRFINFNGVEVEFGEGINVVSTDEEAGYTVLRMRAGGESGATHYGRKITLRSGSWGAFIQGGKNGPESPYSIDFEYYGGEGPIYLGNDGINWMADLDGDGENDTRLYQYGKIKDAKILFEAVPTDRIYLNNLCGIDGTMQVIANNGVKVTMPSFDYKNASDTSTNEDGSAFTADLTPQGGYWRLDSAEGGRVDFTETAGTFRVTTDHTYVIATNKADGTYKRVRVADGVEGDANLFSEDRAGLITLDAGQYDITYTDEVVTVKVVFDYYNKDETYTLKNGESATYTGDVTVPAGYTGFEGWQNADGTVKFSGNTYTADEYIAAEIVLTPVFTRDTSKLYYFTKGIYSPVTGKYDVKVYIGTGKFNVGTFGGEYDDSLTYSGYTLSSGVGADIDAEADIVNASDGAAVIVWNSASGSIDASESDAELFTLHFEVANTDAFLEKFDTTVPLITQYNPAQDYERYYKDGYYQVVEESADEWDVSYTAVYFGQHTDAYAPTEYVDVTFNVTASAKEGPTVTNIAYLAYSEYGADEWSFVALEEAGNEKTEMAVTVSNTFVAEQKYEIKILKNGYIGYEGTFAVNTDSIVSAELLGGDTKGSSEGDDASATDLGDFGDGTVDLGDFVRVIRAFDPGASDDFKHNVDINEDGAVTVADLATVKANYLKSDFTYKLTESEAVLAELDELEEERIAEIRNTANMEAPTEKVVYVSSSEGSDDNDGLTSASPVKTIEKANSLVTENEGWVILLKRGDLWRGTAGSSTINTVAGTTYSAYGEGDKPKIYGSPENGANASYWTLDYENQETGAKIWKYYREDFYDVGTLVFNEGEAFAMKEVPSCVGDVYYVRGQEDLPVTERTPFDYTVELDKNLEFFHSANSTITENATIGNYININRSVGPLYLRCDYGNPGEVFGSIEFNTRPSAINVSTDKNVTIDNLCIKYTGVHGIAAGTVENLTVTNCEIGWIGGSIQGYAANGNTKRSATKLGNGVEVYGGCDGYVIDNCYIYQCYDAGVTHQYSKLSEGNCTMYNVTYSNNLITECVYSIEYFLDTDSTGTYDRHGDNILFDSNILRRAGYGFGSFRPDGKNQRHIRSGGNDNPFTNFVIKNNIFDRSVHQLFITYTDKDECTPVFDGNTYIQGIDNGFYTHAYHPTKTFTLEAEDLLYEIIKDKNGKIYYVENIPYWEYTYPQIGTQS